MFIRWQCIFLFAYCINSLAISQTTWLGTPRHEVSESGNSCLKYHSVIGDLDRDGDNDLVYAFGSRFVVYFNEGYGKFCFRPGHTFYAKDTIFQFKIGDLDQDGDPDIGVIWVSARGVGGTQFFNNDGKGFFKEWFPQGVRTDLFHSLEFFDLDGDGKTDIYLTDMIYFQKSPGVFFPAKYSRYPVNTISVGKRPVIIGDFDGDGDLDVVRNLVGGGCSFMENQGKGYYKDFTAKHLASFSYTSPDYFFSDCGDFDGDGNLDLLFSGKDRANHNVFPVIFWNKGNGVFDSKLKTVLSPAPYLSPSCFFKYSSCGDLTGDGLPEVVASPDTQGSLTYNLAQPLRIWVNLGKRRFMEGTGTYMDLEFCGDAGWPSICDIDGDKDMDLVVPFMYDGVRLFMNNGSHLSDLSQDDFPATGPFPVRHWNTWVIGDLNGDKFPDIIAFPRQGYLEFKRKFLVYLNDGTGRFLNVTDWAAPVEIHPGRVIGNPWLSLHDIDGDGDLDLLEGQQSYGIFLNDGKGKFTEVSGGAIPRWFYCWIDLDGDGLDEAVNDNMEIFKNLGKGIFTKTGKYLWKKENPKWDFWGAPMALDIDNDGDKDVIFFFQIFGPPFQSGTIVLKRTGRSKFVKSQVLHDLPTSQGWYLKLLDLNGDGYIDINVALDYAWINQKNGTFKYARTYRSGGFMDGYFSWGPVYGRNTWLDDWGDMDGDGLPEMWTYFKNMGNLHWKSKRNEYFPTEGPGPFVSGGGCSLVDLDLDGDLDRIFSGGPGDSIVPQVQLNLHQQVATSGTWGIGKVGNVELFGHQGDYYLMMAGMKGKDTKIPGMGLLRLDPKMLLILGAGQLPKDKTRVNGHRDWAIPVPKDPALLGGEIWFQALLSRKGKGLFLTGADRGRVTNF